jgi:CRP-like cAMP-binding protein
VVAPSHRFSDDGRVRDAPVAKEMAAMLEEEGTIRTFDPGEVVFSEGDEGDEMFVIDRGEVELFGRHGESEILLAKLGPEEFFGEMAVLTGAPRSATARAVGRTDLRVIGREELRALVGDPLPWRLLSDVGNRLRAVNERLVGLATEGGVDDGVVGPLIDVGRAHG